MNQPETFTSFDHKLQAEDHPNMWIVYHEPVMATGVVWAAYYEALKSVYTKQHRGVIQASVTYEFQMDSHYHFKFEGLFVPLSYQPKQITIRQRFPNFHDAMLVARNWVYTTRSMQELQNQDIKLFAAVRTLNNALSTVENLPKNRRLNNAIALATRVSNFLNYGTQDE